MEVVDDPPETGTKERKVHEYSALIVAQRDLQRTQRAMQQNASEIEQLQKQLAEKQAKLAEQKEQAAKEEQEQLERTKSYQAASLAYHVVVLAALPAPASQLVSPDASGPTVGDGDLDQRGSRRRQRETPEDDPVEL